MNLLTHLKKFLNTHTDPALPLLLGLSGGEDSMCLFHLLVHAKAQFACVHVDHRWRAESKEEAASLQEICVRQGIPFHKEEVDYSAKTGNMEEYCREERLRIFHRLILAHNYQGVMLAHQAADLSETVLKRVFEGASIVHLKSMEKVSSYKNMLILRPLLDVKKQEIQDYIRLNQIEYFTDRTNSDEKYLRARMRLKLFPEVTQLFGKSIEDPLIRIAEESAMISHFLDQQTEPFIAAGHSCSLGYFLDLSNVEKMHIALAMHLLTRVSKELKMTLSRTQKEDAAKALIDGRANLSFETEGKRLEIDRKRILFFTSDKLAPFTFEALKKGGVNSSSLIIQEDAEASTQPWKKFMGWQCLFRGGGVLQIPVEGDLQIKRVMPGESFPGNSPIAKFWTNRKVPACLRSYLPGIYQGEQLIADLATGEVRGGHQRNCSRTFYVTLDPLATQNQGPW
ncbi:tRNA lysidine(34) synthetase TilS [Estrella lausannensis]|uniref:tRNA(Ile)-lysidine synthase n=1 Tax=Estrella lausannensis TaxID=483423 RepID=A0A0H5DS34_9BACT|nr:tRNA lysidine(34) synthetase TilS [Estrella lausannensis]CRX39482.1 tRNA(Ile)-lysidine synthase [Estrella lausannensis]